MNPEEKNILITICMRLSVRKSQLLKLLVLNNGVGKQLITLIFVSKCAVLPPSKRKEKKRKEKLEQQ